MKLCTKKERGGLGQEEVAARSGGCGGLGREDGGARSVSAG